MGSGLLPGILKRYSMKKNKSVKTASVSDVEKLRALRDHLATFVNPFSVCAEIAEDVISKNPDLSILELKKLVSATQNEYFHYISK